MTILGLSLVKIPPGVRYSAAWMSAIMTAGIYLYFSWHHFDDPTRRDGNRGHTYMDFGGQYLLGRMLVRGEGHHLFSRSAQREVLMECYPHGNEPPDQETSDADQLLDWFVETNDSADQAVSGPLYPPVQAFWFYPLALLTPQVAYRMVQEMIVLGAFGAGLGLSTLSNGRVWWPIATIGVILFPGFAGSLGLGQNSVFSLLILVWGWVLISRGNPGWGGIVWGLLIFKPVWLAAFFLVPLWSGRWRVCTAMLVSSALQAALTLPVVGIHGWIDWLKVGREAARVSLYDPVWIFRGRDLVALPRRWLDFDAPSAELQNNMMANLVGWGLWVIVIEITTRIAVHRKCGGYLGYGPAFLFLGAWLSCVHFMYYDVLLAALPVFLLYQGARRPPWICHVLVAILFLAPAIPAAGWGEPATETYCLLTLWIISGWIWMRAYAKSDLTLLFPKQFV
jgi:arabinofuranan 3-O-arabinosyltransferase